MKTFQDFLHLMDFIGNQTVQSPKNSFSAASKGFKQHQTMNKGLIWTLRVMTRKKICSFLSQNRAFVLIKLQLFYLFFKWPILSLDKTLIHRLVSFKAIWSCTETLIFIFLYSISLTCDVITTINWPSNLK